MRVQEIRRMIECGMSDQEIEQAMSDIEVDNAAAADAHDAAYGPADSDDFGGPVHLYCDGYYSRNDAGEYSWM